MGHMVGYFVYNGDTYSAGSVICFKTGYFICPSWETQQEVIFLGHNTKEDKYAIGKKGYETTYWLKKEEFYDHIIEVTDKIERESCYTEFADTFNESYDRNNKVISSDVWWLYITVMVVAVIFKDCIGIWAFATYLLVDYRNSKLKKRGGR